MPKTDVRVGAENRVATPYYVYETRTVRIEVVERKPNREMFDLHFLGISFVLQHVVQGAVNERKVGR